LAEVDAFLEEVGWGEGEGEGAKGWGRKGEGWKGGRVEGWRLERCRSAPAEVPGGGRSGRERGGDGSAEI